VNEEVQKWTPDKLVKKLKERVIGQDRYLKDLCTSVWLHNLRKESYEVSGFGLPSPKLNLLVLGHSGTGKTESIRSLARILDLNLVIEDSSLFTGAGWKGRETTSIIKDVMLSSGKNKVKAQYSIVVLDEIDKIFDEASRAATLSAVNNFLKLIEGAVIEHTEGVNSVYTMDTKDILFICLGAFDGLEDIIRHRLRNGRGIGFCAERNPEPEDNIFQYVQKEDLILYGVNPQFLGRMAMITATNELKEEDLFHILTESQVSAVNQFDVLLRAGMGVRASMTEAAARQVAAKAVRENTGARALLSEVTEAFKEGVYQIADREDIRELQLDYTPQQELTLRFIKGKREGLPVYKSDLPDSRLHSDEWAAVPLELMKYGCNLAGVCRFTEELVEESELQGHHQLSDHFTHRQIRAAVYLIISAVLDVITTDTDQNMHEVGQVLRRTVIDIPDISNKGREGEDTYITFYWKSMDYNPNMQQTAKLSLLLLEEYCFRRLEEETEQDKEL